MKITVNNVEIELTQDQLKQIDAEVKKNQDSNKTTKEERFWELINETTLKIDKSKYPNLISGFKKNRCLWEYNIKNGYLYLSYDLIWSVFKNEYSMSYNEIQSFIKNEIETIFNCKSVIPKSAVFHPQRAIEDTFNRVDVTPYGYRW